MTDPHIRAAFYLSPTLDALWRWSVDGETLTWADDRTIAFRAEVEAVLRRLQPGGLPPFGAVALLLAACRDTWLGSKGRDAVARYARQMGAMSAGAAESPGATPGTAPVPGPAAAPQLVFRWIANEFDRLLEGLDAVNRLPAALREPLASKALLAEVVFESAKGRSSPEDAALIVRAFDEGVAPETLRPRLCNEEALSQFAHEVEGMPGGLARVDAELLARRAKTGVDEAVHRADDDLSPPERVRRLLAELRDDPELAGLARLAHDLMAAVSVPRTLRLREELAVGGVSDLTNRGPLDRLLVSELAHDDLTLAVRVAVNEALYLRRESPPREPPHRRAILIDAGIRMWGVPRIFAAAVALALVATNDPRAELSVFRASRRGVETVDLTTRRGLEAHLGALDAGSQPGASLAPFFDRLVADDTTGEPTDAVVITHPDALADRAFVAAFLALPEPSAYVATVDRGGAFRLSALSRAGQKIVRDAKLSLDTILRPKVARTGGASAGVPLIATGVELSLPAILYADPFPLRLPHVADPRTAAVSKQHGLVAATDDGRLLHWTDDRHGARQLTSMLPKGAVRFVHIREDFADVVLVVDRAKGREVDLIRASFAPGRPTVIRLAVSGAGLLGVVGRGADVCLVYDRRIESYDVVTGQQIGKLELQPGTRWMRDRFFRHPNGWCACLAAAGANLRLETVPIAAAAITTLFDRPGYDGPFALFKDGSVGDTTTDRILSPDAARSAHLFEGVSPDGGRLLFKVQGNRWIHEIVETPGKPRAFQGTAEALLAPEIYWSTNNSIVRRNKFSGVFVAADSQLMLRTRTGDVIEIVDSPAPSHGVLQFKLNASPRPVARLEARFQETRRSQVARFKMHAATWDDGSRAWLDSRGLFHLKSSDRSVPELSFVLTNSMPAAWSSEGKLAGPDYFVGEDAAQADAGYFLDLVARFVARLR